jgi:hypothetical protein
MMAGNPIFFCHMLTKNLPILLALFLSSVSILYAQDAPSLGDVARHIRAEKGNTSAPAAINTNPAKASAAASPANAQAPAAIVTADKQAPAIGQFGPYATKEEFNLHFLDRYEEGIRVLFEQEKFETLDSTHHLFTSDRPCCRYV